MSHTQPETSDTSRLAFRATIRCLTGCGIGEVLWLTLVLVRAVHGSHS